MKSKSGSFGLRPLAMPSPFMRMLSIFLVSAVALILTATASEIWAKERQSEILFSRTKMIIEFNSSANEGVGDVGVQVLLDGEPWQSLKIESPHGRTILDITASKSLKKQGLTELFFESSEPSLDEVPLAKFPFPGRKIRVQGENDRGAKDRRTSDIHACYTGWAGNCLA